MLRVFAAWCNESSLWRDGLIRNHAGVGMESGLLL